MAPAVNSGLLTRSKIVRYFVQISILHAWIRHLKLRQINGALYHYAVRLAFAFPWSDYVELHSNSANGHNTLCYQHRSSQGCYTTHVTALLIALLLLLLLLLHNYHHLYTRNLGSIRVEEATRA